MKYYRRGGVNERNNRPPARPEQGDERRRGQQDRGAAARPGTRMRVAGGGPAQEPVAEHQVRLVPVEDERAVRKVVQSHVMTQRATRLRIDELAVEPLVDRVGVRGARVERPPERHEMPVVVPAAERARAVAGGEGRRLVEEEQLREAARPHERLAPPVAEPEPARDPPLTGVAAPDAPVLVVQTAAVAVHEPPRRVCDQVAERRDPVLPRHQAGPDRSRRERNGDTAAGTNGRKAITDAASIAPRSPRPPASAPAKAVPSGNAPVPAVVVNPKARAWRSCGTSAWRTAFAPTPYRPRARFSSAQAVATNATPAG